MLAFEARAGKPTVSMRLTVIKTVDDLLAHLFARRIAGNWFQLTLPMR